MSSPPERPDLPTRPPRAASARIEAGGERLWSYADFAGMPPVALAKTLSRLPGEGELQRAGKGLYYRPRRTVVGRSRPSPGKVAEASARHTLHPSGLSAANLLGFTTQNAAAGQYATTGTNRPTKLAGSRVLTRRPAAREDLDTEDGALLEFLRDRAALTEPPRMRAILGAAGQQAGHDEGILSPLRASLNPLTRFDFGLLRGLQNAREWQAK